MIKHDTQGCQSSGGRAQEIRLLRHDKALIINTTHFKETYQGEFGKAMARIPDNCGLRYPAVKKVEHVCFYGADVSDAETRHAWLNHAYRLAKDFDS